MSIKIIKCWAHGSIESHLHCPNSLVPSYFSLPVSGDPSQLQPSSTASCVMLGAALPAEASMARPRKGCQSGFIPVGDTRGLEQEGTGQAGLQHPLKGSAFETVAQVTHPSSPGRQTIPTEAANLHTDAPHQRFSEKAGGQENGYLSYLFDAEWCPCPFADSPVRTC